MGSDLSPWIVWLNLRVWSVDHNVYLTNQILNSNENKFLNSYNFDIMKKGI